MRSRAPTRAICSACRASLSSSTLPLRHSVSSTFRTSRLRSEHARKSLSRRSYATTSRPSSDSSSAAHVPAWPSSPNPTPYEVFGMARREPYAKSRFHQLVKLYHPDVSSPSTAALPQATRVERYRLVVAANDLLSDPSRRQMYDDHGAGWSHGRGGYADGDLRGRDRDWRYREGSAARNATWEDWEAWHQEQRRRQYGGEPPKPVYMSNGMFAALVVAMCMVGAMAQKNRAMAVGEQYVEFTQGRNADIGQQVRTAAGASMGRSREERIEAFVRDRENTSFRYRPNRYETRSPTAEDGQPQEQQPQQAGLKLPPS